MLELTTGPVQLVAAGVVAPVELGAALSDNFRAERSLAAFSYDSALYGLPFGVENIALVCNSSMVPSQPATWDEVVAAGVEVAMGEDGQATHTTCTTSRPLSVPQYSFRTLTVPTPLS